MLDQLAGLGMKLCYKAASHSRYTSMLMAHQHGASTPSPFESGCSVLGHKDPHIVHLTSHFMFTYSATRTSDACQFVHVDLLRGVATVSFKNGHMYEYKNVSRRAIASLMANPNMSLGFWVNHNCVDAVRTSYAVVPDYSAA